jgi:hypothetical protein
MSTQCTNLTGDRAIGQYWETQFCVMAGASGRSMTPHQIKRTGSAIAGKLTGQMWNAYTLPDVTLWTAPGEHHEIKHKAPTRHGGVSLEDYRLRALLWFANETQQPVYYTLHLHSMNGGRDNQENNLSHWFTIEVRDMQRLCESGIAYHSPNMKTWCGGRVEYVPGWYWPIKEFMPLMDLWYPQLITKEG